MSHGPLMLDLAGMEVTAEEKEILCHPAAGGIILFSRNFESPEQVKHLIDSIHEIRSPKLLVAVDQEGGRVQRFREGFSRLPAAARFGEIYQHDHERAFQVSENIGWLMASELRAVGVDFSFAPVLDINSGVSEVIGDRAFHAKPDAIASLAHAWMKGVHAAGMPTVGKHYPGHGCVEADSHLALPVDQRQFTEIEKNDLLPFRQMIDYGLDAIMPAHVVYPAVDAELAGFSPFWLKEVLRKRLGFQGVIFSDDLTMAAAELAGTYPERAMAALQAGCDMVLVCNNQDAAIEVLESLETYSDPVAQSRLARMHGKGQVDLEKLKLKAQWQNAMNMLDQMHKNQSLDLNLTDPTEQLQ